MLYHLVVVIFFLGLVAGRGNVRVSYTQAVGPAQLIREFNGAVHQKRTTFPDIVMAPYANLKNQGCTQRQWNNADDRQGSFTNAVVFVDELGCSLHHKARLCASNGCQALMVRTTRGNAGFLALQGYIDGDGPPAVPTLEYSVNDDLSEHLEASLSQPYTRYVNITASGSVNKYRDISRSDLATGMMLGVYLAIALAGTAVMFAWLYYHIYYVMYYFESKQSTEEAEKRADQLIGTGTSTEEASEIRRLVRLPAKHPVYLFGWVWLLALLLFACNLTRVVMLPMNGMWSGRYDWRFWVTSYGITFPFQAWANQFLTDILRVDKFQVLKSTSGSDDNFAMSTVRFFWSGRSGMIISVFVHLISAILTIIWLIVTFVFVFEFDESYPSAMLPALITFLLFLFVLVYTPMTIFIGAALHHMYKGAKNSNAASGLKNLFAGLARYRSLLIAMLFVVFSRIVIFILAILYADNRNQSATTYWWVAWVGQIGVAFDFFTNAFLFMYWQRLLVNRTINARRGLPTLETEIELTEKDVDTATSTNVGSRSSSSRSNSKTKLKKYY